MFNASEATTTYGPVRGRVLDGVHTFLGIRYGADTAAYRFQPPRPPEPWTAVANAFAFGPTAPQDHPDTAVDRALNPFLVKIGLTDNLPEDEDCLFLNVWTPGTAASARAAGETAGAEGRADDAAGGPDGAPAPGTTGSRPVLVWVHSGAYASNSGSSPSIDGAHLAREHDLVVVTFNHRLGPLGYTQVVDPVAEPDSPYAASGNVGMLDVVAALEWVRDNIAAFGGDPGSVTLAGQSGGAMKISTLLAMPVAAGLFHRAILCSGTTTLAQDVSGAVGTGRRLREAAGLAADCPPEELAALDVRDLLRASFAVSGAGAFVFSPVADGRVLPCEPFSDEALALAADVPVVLGDLDTEAALFLSARHEALEAQGTDGLEAALAGTIGAGPAGELVPLLRSGHPQAGPYELAVRASSDLGFAAHTRLAALRRARRARAQGGAPTWRYRITWRTPVDDGVLMSTHELDVALAFGNVDVAAGLNGGGDDARALSRTIGALWASFARTGDPRTTSGVAWPVWDEDDRRTLLLTPAPEVGGDVDGAELDVAGAVVGLDVDWIGGVGGATDPPTGHPSARRASR